MQEFLQSVIPLLVPLILFFIVIYFFIMKPEKKRRQQIYEMQSQLKVDDKIVTIGGIHGIIEEIKDDTITIIIASGAKMKIDKSAVRNVIKDA